MQVQCVAARVDTASGPKFGNIPASDSPYRFLRQAQFKLFAWGPKQTTQREFDSREIP